ncbi:hypothetical protein MTX78_03850 [Hymenobacter tibetensis]|uniref:Outer membrane protein beta-barrel domain-containing protein n=1 Tax=Hymenobacter tibetensis TaxID=497967 RepID=A0ABY4D002_9BACT|nr:hypothetical protein [Hymenobacter tibetensis]UOG75733.1 hypothetical protein MTX78_03850 [Hymenobacter tibetensis]
MLPSTSQIREKGEVEVQGTTFLNGRWEAGATYSPVKHLLVRAAGGIKTDDRDTTYFRVRQYEMGIGGYYPLGKRWLLSGLGGYGQTRSSRGYFDVGPFVSIGENVAFKARYHKLYGEASASYRAPWVTMGVAYRLTRVTFTSLTYDSQPLDLRHMTRMEPMVFWRFGREDGALPWLRVQASIGGSNEGRRKYDPNESYERRLIKDGRGFAALSVILLPHLFAQKTE